MVVQHDFPGLARLQHGGVGLDRKRAFDPGSLQLDPLIPPVEQGNLGLLPGQQGHGEHTDLQVGGGRIDSLDDERTRTQKGVVRIPDRVVLFETHGQAHGTELAGLQAHRIFEAPFLQAGEQLPRFPSVHRLQDQPESVHEGTHRAGQDHRPP